MPAGAASGFGRLKQLVAQSPELRAFPEDLLLKFQAQGIPVVEELAQGRRG